MDNYQLDHVGIAVLSIDASAPIFSQITGSYISPTEHLPEMQVNVAFVGSIELIEPRSPSSPISKHIGKHGSALHHLAYVVPNIQCSLKAFSELGFHLIDETPRKGSRGHQVAFIHPKDTNGILIELVQSKDEI